MALFPIPQQCAAAMAIALAMILVFAIADGLVPYATLQLVSELHQPVLQHVPMEMENVWA